MPPSLIERSQPHQIPIEQALHLAIQHHQAGRLQEAEQIYRAILAVQPRHALANHNIGVLASQVGNLDAAEYHIRIAVDIIPNNTQFLSNLGEIFSRVKKLDDADIVLRKALEIDPKNTDALVNIGSNLSKQERLKSAEQALREALEIKPDHVGALMNLGAVLNKQERLEEAEIILRKALEIKPDHVDALVNLGVTLNTQKRLEEVEIILRKALEIKPDHVDALVNLGVTLNKQERLEEAETILRKALEIKPDHVAALVILGITLFEQNHIKNSKIALIKALRIDRENPDAHITIANCYHSEKSYFKAARHYIKGNAILAKNEPYNSTEWNDRICFEFDQFEKFVDLGMPFGPKDIMPVFIVGMPRSGTSLLEQILDSHSMVRGAGELPHIKIIADNLRLQPTLDADYLRALSEGHLQKLRTLADGKVFVTDKRPQNFLHIGLISALFPGARIIYCKRDARDNCLSIFRLRFNRANSYAHNLHDLGVYYRTHERIMRHWQGKVENPILTVNYEDVIGDIDEQVRHVLEFLELPYESSCLNFHNNPRKVMTPSRFQVKQALYSSSIDKWKSYSKYLGPLFSALDNN